MSYLDSLFNLAGKVAVVTGGGRGIGQTVSLGLAKAGAIVYILSRSGADDTMAMIKDQGQGQAYSLICDVVSENDVERSFEHIMKTHQRVDIVFNNAGICIHKNTFLTSVDEWRQVLDINLTGQFIVAKKAAELMVSKNIQGSIINMASMSGSIVNVRQWQASYNASKAGVIHMTRSLAVEWAPYGIRVNSISPGYIATPMSVDTPRELKDAWFPLIPLERMGNPEELLPVILYLASDAAGYTTGSDVVVDGGYSAR